MENATKALLMAAGILIAIIVFTLGVVVYGRISGFYQTKQSNLSEEQLAAFNSQYTVYDRADVSGFELVSLINKCIDFNQNQVYGANNTDESDTSELGNGYLPISVSVQLNSDYSGKLFTNKKYTYTGKNSGERKSLQDSINEMQTLERKYNSSDLTKLASRATDIAEMAGKGQDITDTIKEITGKKYNITSEQISKYADFLTFKRGTYKCTKMDSNKNNGQIYIIEFQQIK